MNDPLFTHFDARGRASMVDVSTKEITRRTARASCKVVMSDETIGRLSELPKGDALTLARAAGILAAKRVDQLIPLAHPIPIDHVQIEIEAHRGQVEISSSVVATARTGAELEALAACAGAALTLYDMVKSVEKGAVVTDLRLEHKSGGRSGEYDRS